MKFAILACALVYSQAAHAEAPQTLFVMSNDRDDAKVTNSVLINGDTVTGFQTSPGQSNRSDTFPLAQVAQPAGAVLLSGQGHNVLFLQGSLDRASQQGRFHLKYLANGLTDNYATCDFLLKKNGTNFYAENAYTGARITNAKIVTWSLGLQTLEGICP